MVVTKVFQIKNTNKLKQGLKYIDDKDKTEKFVNSNIEEELEGKINYIFDKNKTISKENIEEISNSNAKFFTDNKDKKQLVSSYGLSSVKHAYEEIMMTKKLADEHLEKNKNNKKSKVDVLAHHIIQSFSPEDNLTPEEVHEIGRRTILELTKGEYEFVIATHMDKNHLHNHIIFSTTSSVNLKKFRWTKGTKNNLENISDKHADFFGAKIIDREKIINHKKYEAYKKQNTLRYEIKERLKFLIKNSNSVDDFLEKAKLLNVEVVLGGKEIKYKLLDKKQERYVRDLTLSKKGYYSFENIKKVTQQNKNVPPKENIKEEYEHYKEKKDDDFEIRLNIEDWQVVKETKRGIYIEVEFGLNNQGLILIPWQKIDKLENNTYDIFLKRNDYFYFLNERDSSRNKYIKGSTLAKQLSRENNKEAIYKNYYVGKIDKLIEEFNYLSTNNVTGYESFSVFQEKFEKRINEAENELDRLDKKIAELNKLQSALLGKLGGDTKQKIVAEEILSKLKIPIYTNLSEVEKMINEIRIERDILREKLSEVIGEYKYTKKLKKNVDVRKENEKINRNERKSKI